MVTTPARGLVELHQGEPAHEPAHTRAPTTPALGLVELPARTRAPSWSRTRWRSPARGLVELRQRGDHAGPLRSARARGRW